MDLDARQADADPDDVLPEHERARVGRRHGAGDAVPDARPPISFGAFTPGVARTYIASTTATVISSAGDATLSVVDPSTNSRAAWSTARSRWRCRSRPGPARRAFAALSGTPLTLKTYAGPVANDMSTLDFQQRIGANDPLRTGTYSKTLTYTLSTTNP